VPCAPPPPPAVPAVVRIPWQYAAGGDLDLPEPAELAGFELPGAPWQYGENLSTGNLPTGYEIQSVGQRGLFDIIKKSNVKGLSPSMMNMFARLSCAERAPSVFEPPDGHHPELEQVRCLSYIYLHTRLYFHTHFHTHTLASP